MSFHLLLSGTDVLILTGSDQLRLGMVVDATPVSSAVTVLVPRVTNNNSALVDVATLVLTPVVANTGPGGVVSPTILTLTSAVNTPVVNQILTWTPDILRLTLEALDFSLVTAGAIPHLTFTRVEPRYRVELLRVTDSLEP